MNKWLLPLSFIYGTIVQTRNKLFNAKIIKSKTYDIPIISVGNITVGGTGKTPHIEYLVDLLIKENFNIAVLSRGYKRKTKGFILADNKSTAFDIGDEPKQIKTKFPKIDVAVCENRQHGIEELLRLNHKLNVILLDDSYQHRYVKPHINILLTDYNRLITRDKLLPVGRLREPVYEKSRADIIIVTKCVDDLKPMDFRVIEKEIEPYPYQQLYFSKIKYNKLKPIYCGKDKDLSEITDKNILLVTGVANNKNIVSELKKYSTKITELTFNDHHNYNSDDIQRINDTFKNLSEPKIAITTHKDSVKLFGMNGFNEDVRHNFYILPIEVEMINDDKNFNKYITNYVQNNPRNRSMAKKKNDNKPKNSDNTRNRTRTISF